MLPSAQSRASLGKASPLLDIPHTVLTDDRSVAERYDFLAKLGEGSFGVVHEVVHRDSDQRWACKVIHKEKAGGPRIKLINREVGILKQVHHTHIIQLREVLETSQKMYLVMELCEGGELSKFLQRNGGRLCESEVRVVMERLASAIAYLHKAGFVHRDLKLENVLLSKNPAERSDNLYIKVTDFGLSVVKGGVSTDDMMNDFCGTPLYMAPEIMGNRMYSEKCDVWAMGVIMCLLLIGSSPFPANCDLAQENIDAKVKGKDWNHVSERARNCVSRMLQTDTAHRFAASEVHSHAFIQDQPLESVQQDNVLDLMKKFRDENLQQSLLLDAQQQQVEGEGVSEQHGAQPITFTVGKKPKEASSADKASTMGPTRQRKTFSTTEPSKLTEKTRSYQSLANLPSSNDIHSTPLNRTTTSRGGAGAGTKDKRTVAGGEQKRSMTGANGADAAVNGHGAHGATGSTKAGRDAKI